jgi:hypothetical protein
MRMRYGRWMATPNAIPTTKITPKTSASRTLVHARAGTPVRQLVVDLEDHRATKDDEPK